MAGVGARVDGVARVGKAEAPRRDGFEVDLYELDVLPVALDARRGADRGPEEGVHGVVGRAGPLGVSFRPPNRPAAPEGTKLVRPEQGVGAVVVAEAVEQVGHFRTNGVRVDEPVNLVGRGLAGDPDERVGVDRLAACEHASTRIGHL